VLEEAGVPGENHRHKLSDFRCKRDFYIAFVIFCSCIHKTGGCLPFAPIKCNKIITAVFKFHKKYIAEHLPMPVWYDNTDGANDDNNVFGIIIFINTIVEFQ
jgi:hypothetical protein